MPIILHSHHHYVELQIIKIILSPELLSYTLEFTTLELLSRNIQFATDQNGPFIFPSSIHCLLKNSYALKMLPT